MYFCVYFFCRYLMYYNKNMFLLYILYMETFFHFIFLHANVFCFIFLCTFYTFFCLFCTTKMHFNAFLLKMHFNAFLLKMHFGRKNNETHGGEIKKFRVRIAAPKIHVLVLLFPFSRPKHKRPHYLSFT